MENLSVAVFIKRTSHKFVSRQNLSQSFSKIYRVSVQSYAFSGCVAKSELDLQSPDIGKRLQRCRRRIDIFNDSATDFRFVNFVELHYLILYKMYLYTHTNTHSLYVRVYTSV